MLWLPILLFCALATPALVGIAGFTVHRLCSDEERPERMRWFWLWFIKGLLVPLTLWLVMNLTLGLGWRSFLPKIPAATRAALAWLPDVIGIIVTGGFAVSSYWAALTIGWTLVLAGRGLEGESRSDFRALCVTSLVGMALPAAGILWVGGSMCLGLAAFAMLVPIAGYAPDYIKPKKQRPMYSRAIARVKFGKYAEAEWEIISQLEKAENDFDGWLMLAELYANHYRDVPEAEQTIIELCEQPAITPSQLSVALHKLADWYLNLSNDPDAARRALGVISKRLPGTHLARMAESRAASLPANAQELREQRENRPVPLPALSDNLDEDTPAEPLMPRSEAEALLDQLSERLEREPDNTAAREKLARVLAESLGAADAAIEQVQWLLALPDQPDERRAEWRAMLAAWLLRYRHDRVAARAALERLLRDHPHSPQAFTAQRRLRLMEMEDRVTQQKHRPP